MMQDVLYRSRGDSVYESPILRVFDAAYIKTPNYTQV